MQNFLSIRGRLSGSQPSHSFESWIPAEALLKNLHHSMQAAPHSRNESHFLALHHHIIGV